MFCYNLIRGNVMSAKRYFKFDESDQYLENDADINYFVINQARRVAFGNMLGDFNEEGIYVIDEKIVKELLLMPKIVVDSVEGADLIRGAIRFDGYIHFMLNIEDDRAKLILLEKINFESNIKYNVGRYSNMNEYVLGEVMIPDRDVDKNVIYSKFNILREDDGKYYDFRDLTQKELENFDGLMTKMKRNLVVQNELYNNETAIEIAEADYFDNILSAFSKNQKLRAEFEQFLKTIILEKEKFIEINKPFFQKTMNEILDGAVLVFLAKLSPELRAEIEEEIRKAKEKYFYDFTKLVHLQYVLNSTANVEMNDNMINGIVVGKNQALKISQFEISEKEMEKSFETVLNKNDEIKSKTLEKNANKKDITEDNPKLTKFFGEIKKETGNDLLKPKEETTELIKKSLGGGNAEKASSDVAHKKENVAQKKSSLISRGATQPANTAVPKVVAETKKPVPTVKKPATQPNTKVETKSVSTNKTGTTTQQVTQKASTTKVVASATRFVGTGHATNINSASGSSAVTKSGNDGFEANF